MIRNIAKPSKGKNMSRLEILNGSCIDQNVDAIVNAANRELWSGGDI